MKNYLKSGQNLTFVADADYASGSVVVVGDIVGVNAYDVLTGEEGEIAITGVFTLPKQGALAVVMGEKAYWDGAEVDNIPGDDGQNVEIGVFAKAAAGADTTAAVLLKGGSRASN